MIIFMCSKVFCMDSPECLCMSEDMLEVINEWGYVRSGLVPLQPASIETDWCIGFVSPDKSSPLTWAS